MFESSRPPWPRLRNGTRWTYATVVVGLLFGGVQILHTIGMLRFGLVGALLEGVVPLVFALGLAASGPWLQYRGYTRIEQKRIVGWMALVGVVSGLLFLWALSHQMIVAGESLTSTGGGEYGSAYGAGGSAGPGGGDDGFSRYASGGVFPHAKFVTATNLTAGALLGLLLGVYNVRSRRHYRVAQEERERVARQRTRLSVLNRVLRHNLRNDASVILMSLREIATRSDGELAEYAEMAADKTNDLVGLGEKARRIDATIDDDVAYTDDLDLRTTVRRVIEDVPAEETSVEWSVDVPDGMSLTTNGHLLREVLEELIANAAEHGGTDPVRVRITARSDADGWVELVVADDGPGIPEQERVSFDADEETELEHASGLGLWLVRWGVMALGGTVAYEESEWGGTAVRIRLPVTPDDTAGVRTHDDPVFGRHGLSGRGRPVTPARD